MRRKRVVGRVNGLERDAGCVPALSAGDSEDQLVRELTARLRQGDRAAQEELFRRFHSELHILATHLMRKQRAALTLQPTVLVNESYIKLFGREPIACQDKAHLMRASARAMNQFLIDYVRHKRSQKRSPPGRRVEIVPSAVPGGEPGGSSYLEFSDEVEHLAKTRPDMARAILLRYVVGLTEEEIACVLGQPLRTFQRAFKAASVLMASRMR